MTLSVTSTYNFGPSKYIVSTDPASCSTTDVMTAFNAVVAAGGGTIYIQPGTYTFNGTFNTAGTSVGIIGSSTIEIGSVLGTPSTSVMFTGTQTLSGAGSISFENITFQSSGATVTGTMPASSSAAFINCTMISTSASNAALSYTGSGVTSYIAMENCNFIGSSTAASFANCNVSSTNNGFFAGTASGISLGATTNFIGQISSFSSTSGYAMSITSATVSAETMGCSYSSSSSSAAPVNFTATGSLTSLNDNYNSTASNSYFATTTNSSAGIFKVGNAIPISSATQINPLLATTYFSTTSGTGLRWQDISSSQTALVNQGYFATATLTITLPASPSEGNTVAFVADTSSIVTIQANAGQTIRLGNVNGATAGSLTTTARGDSGTLVYRSSSQTWIATQSVGNLNLV